ncbi:hypothetical protein ABE096_17640 [Robertmurraya massiliosenegalensis]
MKTFTRLSQIMWVIEWKKTYNKSVNKIGCDILGGSTMVLVP